MYDRPFQWGSKRTGPDLARVGGRYSDDWHVAHFNDPQSVVPESIMPSYAFLADRLIDPGHIADKLRTRARLCVPDTDEMIASAAADLRARADPEADHEALPSCHPEGQARNFDGQPGISEMDAMIAYLQRPGTLADFPTFTLDESR